MQFTLRRLEAEVLELHGLKVAVVVPLRRLERDAVAVVRRHVGEGIRPVSVYVAIFRHVFAVIEKDPVRAVVRSLDFPSHRKTACMAFDWPRPDSVGIDKRRLPEVVGDGNREVVRCNYYAVRVVRHTFVVVVEEIRTGRASIERSRGSHAGRRRIGRSEIDRIQIPHRAGADLRSRRNIEFVSVEVDCRFGRDFKRRAEGAKVAVGREGGVGEGAEAAGKSRTRRKRTFEIDVRDSGWSCISHRFTQDVLAEPVGGIRNVAVTCRASPPRLFHGVGNVAIEESALRDDRLDTSGRRRCVELECNVLRDFIPRNELVADSQGAPGNVDCHRSASTELKLVTGCA